MHVNMAINAILIYMRYFYIELAHNIFSWTTFNEKRCVIMGVMSNWKYFPKNSDI